MRYRLSIARGRRREKKECHVRREGIDRRRASTAVYRGLSKVRLSIERSRTISAHACITIPAGRRRIVYHGSATAADNGEAHRDKYRNLASGLQLDGESEEEGCSVVARAHDERKKRAAPLRARLEIRPRATVLVGDFRCIEPRVPDGRGIARVSRRLVSSDVVSER